MLLLMALRGGRVSSGMYREGDNRETGANVNQAYLRRVFAEYYDDES